MPVDPRKAAADHARCAISKAGGLLGVAELRTRWGGPDRPLTADRVKDLAAEPGFPEPVYPPHGAGGPGVRKLWLAADVDVWWQQRHARTGRPGPKPRKLQSTDQNTSAGQGAGEGQP